MSSGPSQCCHLLRLLFLEDLATCIISWLEFEDVRTLALCSSNTKSALLENRQIWRDLFFNCAKLKKSLFTSIHYGNNSSSSWKALLVQYLDLLRKVHAMPSPGCQYQKNLRWVEGTPASSPVIHRALLGVAFLPDDSKDLSKLHVYRDKIPAKYICALYCMYVGFDEKENRGRNYEYIVNQMLTSRGLKPHEVESSEREMSAVDFDWYICRYLALLRWVVKEECRLRLVMAQVHQMQCRSLGVYLHHRSLEALEDVCRIARGEVSNLRFWA